MEPAPHGLRRFRLEPARLPSGLAPVRFQADHRPARAASRAAFVGGSNDRKAADVRRRVPDRGRRRSRPSDFRCAVAIRTDNRGSACRGVHAVRLPVYELLQRARARPSGGAGHGWARRCLNVCAARNQERYACSSNHGKSSHLSISYFQGEGTCDEGPATGQARCPAVELAPNVQCGKCNLIIGTCTP
jgi:hypothetical protein